jgi:hypothetical protein
VMREVVEGRGKALLIPAGVSGRAEKIGAHIVINPMDRPPQLSKIRDYLRPN